MDARTGMTSTGGLDELIQEGCDQLTELNADPSLNQGIKCEKFEVGNIWTKEDLEAFRLQLSAKRLVAKMDLDLAVELPSSYDKIM